MVSLQKCSEAFLLPQYQYQTFIRIMANLLIQHYFGYIKEYSYL